MSRRFTCATTEQRCEWTITLRDGSEAQCGRAHTDGQLCRQHRKMWEARSCAFCGMNDELPPGHCADCTRDAPSPKEPTRSQKLIAAGYRRRPSWHTLPREEDAPGEMTPEQITLIANQYLGIVQADDIERADDRRQAFARAVIEAALATRGPIGAVEPALTDKQIRAGWERTFSTNNPFCPCDLKSFTKAVNWALGALSRTPGAAE